MNKSKQIAEKNTEFSSVIESLQTNSGEKLRTLQFDVVLENSDKTSRAVNFTLDESFRRVSAKRKAEFIFNLFSLLNLNKRLFLKLFIDLLIQSKNIVLFDLKSFIPKNRGGRRKKYLNRENGEILNMKEPNKTICEMFNKNREPKEIVAEVFKQFRSESGKMKQLKKVRRILKENKEFLTRPLN